MSFIISDFSILRPTYESLQTQGQQWLCNAHIRAEKTQNSNCDQEQFAHFIQSSVSRFGCKENRIQKRGHMLADFLHEDWEKMDIFNLNQSPQGAGFGKRAKCYAKFAEEILNQYYQFQDTAPDDLIHVTCTGYNAPSAAQKVISTKNWMDKTTVTHAYHMGCMASIPALRMATGFLASSKGQLNGSKTRVDIIHTELCTLHMNPALHQADQIVGQTLFSDGSIGYSISESSKEGFKIIAILEEIIPNTWQCMGWECEDWGLYFTLSREVPIHIKNGIEAFLNKLAKRSHYNPVDLKKNALFAIHPGGPKIIDLIKEKLDLSDEQIEASQQILFEYGNMSSATLPHILERLFKQRHPKGTPIIGLAFGPGLTICGVLMEVA